MDAGEKAVVEGVDCKAEDRGINREGWVRDESLDDCSVGDRGDGAVAERPNKEMLGGRVVGDAFGIKIE